jgi:hypothetical protein
METLAHPRDTKLAAFAPLIAIVLLYLLVAAAMLGNLAQHASAASEVALAQPQPTLKV